MEAIMGLEWKPKKFDSETDRHNFWKRIKHTWKDIPEKMDVRLMDGRDLSTHLNRWKKDNEHLFVKLLIKYVITLD